MVRSRYATTTLPRIAFDTSKPVTPEQMLMAELSAGLLVDGEFYLLNPALVQPEYVLAPGRVLDNTRGGE